MVAVPQVQIPNFVGTLGQVEQIQQSRLQAMAQRQATEDAARARQVAGEVLPQLGTLQGPELVGALGRLVGADPRYAAFAAPLIGRERDNMEFFGASGRPAAPAVAAPASGEPMQRIAAVESGGNDAARNPRSSAAGRFQIIDSTWRQYAPRLGLTDAQRMDPQAQEAVARAIQADARQAVGRDLSPGEAYGAHFLGIGGLRAFLGADPNADAQQVYAQAAGPQVAAQAFRANPGLLEPGMTVGQVMQALNRRMGAGGAATPASAPADGAVIPTAGEAPNNRPAAPAIERNADGHIVVPGINMAMVSRAYAAPPGNERARGIIQQYEAALTRHLQVLNMQQRPENAALPPTVTLGDGPHGPAGVYQRNRDGSLTRLGATPPPSTVVNMPGDTVRGRADAATLQEVQRGANDARQLVSLFDRAERAVRNTPEGTGAQLLPIIGQAARAIGIEVAGTEEAEVLRSITNGLAVLQRAPGSGATTDFEMRLYMQSVPRLGNTRQGNLMLIDMGRRLALRRMEEANIWRRHAGEPDLMERLNALPPVFTPDELRVLEGDATPTAQGAGTGAAQATGAGGIQANPPAIPPMPRGLPPGSAFSPSRNMWRTPDGRLFNADGTPAR